ncbi:hypothetical protein SETIT_3G148400v2 [Setaria italica]|uniref:Uncharacterized protein n=2 Tax=Setaria TaxID=4554 RepID=K3ZBB3_SETIT|nr:hypothetical protein SETIT_3G148400v2 [Setaria italica]RCV16568.1 hypothetical protein SETIT_3G148400v2 [Setaria italica]TKW25911.1 hypothetical protein SEVIR_3G151000v2 [Setaria viridis]
MLGRRRGGSSSKSREPNTGTAGAAKNGQGVTVSQFITQLDESVTKRLDRMNQRLRLLEQQMETLEADVAKASRGSVNVEGCS